MPTWSGWVNDFLNSAGVIITPPNRTFMEEWAKHAPGSCKNNPIDLTKAVAGSTRCGATVGGFGRSQNYPTHADASRAFRLQMFTDWVLPLADALGTGNPFQIPDRAAAVAVLERWASPSFASWYKNANADGTTGGSGSGGAFDAHGLGGWRALQHSINHNLPHALRTSKANTNAALRAVSKGRKVKP